MVINTKFTNEKWYCYGTINGYDHSFNDITEIGAQMQMQNFLKSRGIPINQTRWTPTLRYEPKLTVGSQAKNYIGYSRMRIDYL